MALHVSLVKITPVGMLFHWVIDNVAEIGGGHDALAASVNTRLYPSEI